MEKKITSPIEQLYRYQWKNNEKRATLYGRTCRLIAKGSKNSILIEFVDNGERVCTSGNSIRKLNNNNEQLNLGI